MSLANIDAVRARPDSEMDALGVPPGECQLSPDGKYLWVRQSDWLQFLTHLSDRAAADGHICDAETLLG